MTPEEQRQVDRLVGDVATVAKVERILHHTAVDLVVVTYRDTVPGLFGDKLRSVRDALFQLLMQLKSRGTLTVSSIEHQQSIYRVRLRCGQQVLLLPHQDLHSRPE